MKLRALELDQFRKFDRPVRIRGLADGLNLIVGPNEMGKSTLLAALRAALFERHRSSAKIVQSFQPSRHQTAPQVALDFEIGGAAWRIEKQFLKRPHARLHRQDGSRVDGDDAEAELETLLAFDQAGRRDGDIWNVLWVAQGDSFALPEVGGARATLQACLDAELGQAIGDDRGPALIAAIETALLELVDRRGKPRARHLQLEGELAGLRSEIALDEQRAQELEEDFARLEQAQGSHDQLTREQATRDDPAALAAARAQRDGLIMLAARVREAEAAEAMARQTFLQAERSAAERAELIVALAAAEARIEQAAAAEAEAGRQAAAGEAAVGWQQGEVERLEAARAEHQRRAAGLRSLRRLLRQAEDSRAALDARATEVALTFEPEALERVQIGGRPAERIKQTLQAVDPVEIAIEGVGRIGIRPRVAQAERWRRDLADAEHQVAGLLQELGLVRQDEAPTGRSGQLSLFGSRSEQPPDLASIEGLSAETEKLVEQLAGQALGARTELEQRIESHRRLDLGAARTRAQLEQARTEQAERRQRLAEAEEVATQAELADAVVAARETLELATAELARLRQGDPAAALVETEARIGQLEAAIEQRGSRLSELRGEIEGLQARVAVHAGEGFAERLELARRRLLELEREHAKCRREVEALQLLRTTLSEAERAAKERYLAPVALRIRPYLQALFPDAEIAVDEALRITGIRRGPSGDEPFEQLSDGTREQIAILVRLALAELLCDRGLPAVVVLDDALVFSDDERIQRMFGVLARAAERLQIVVLTCRERLFDGLDGKRLHLEFTSPPPEARGAA
jgi:DNA repair exonuclease SbcCD ATPase subunit